MTKKIIGLILFSVFTTLSTYSQHQAGDTIIIETFSFDDPSPEGWSSPYKGTFNFPTVAQSWEKIIMLRRLKCDSATALDKYPCGEWDYFTHTFLSIPKGDSSEIFELGSFITPYGKRLKMGGDKGWMWAYDITEYEPLLKGAIEITSGNNAELLDLKFLFIKGTPTRYPISVENIYPWGIYKYEYLADDSLLKEKQIILNPAANTFMLKARISGHGHAGPLNCCEWDSKTHTYYINDWERFRWNVWKDCGFNPIYPQGGTWPFDRAGWCPGTKVDEYDFEITNKVNPGDTIKFDYGIEHYTDNGEKEGEFRMSHQLFSFGPPNFSNDAAIVDIIAPSDEDQYSRINPICDNPRIIIQNTGKHSLHTLQINFGIKGQTKEVFYWSGQLDFLQVEEVWLPTPDWHNFKEGLVFEVEIRNPNKTQDEYSNNNFLQSTIAVPLVLPSTFQIKVLTNGLGRACENEYSIINSMGQLKYYRDDLEDYTEYTDELKLEAGCYEFRLTDKQEDGMIRHWWERGSNPELVGEDGKIEIYSVEGVLLHELDYDFGQKLLLSFIIE